MSGGMWREFNREEHGFLQTLRLYFILLCVGVFLGRGSANTLRQSAELLNCSPPFSSSLFLLLLIHFTASSFWEVNLFIRCQSQRELMCGKTCRQTARYHPSVFTQIFKSGIITKKVFMLSLRWKCINKKQVETDWGNKCWHMHEAVTQGKALKTSGVCGAMRRL